MAIADQWTIGDQLEQEPYGLAKDVVRGVAKAALWVVLTPLVAIAMGLWAMASASLMLAASLLLASGHKFRLPPRQVESDV